MITDIWHETFTIKGFCLPRTQNGTQRKHSLYSKHQVLYNIAPKKLEDFPFCHRQAKWRYPFVFVFMYSSFFHKINKWYVLCILPFFLKINNG